MSKRRQRYSQQLPDSLQGTPIMDDLEPTAEQSLPTESTLIETEDDQVTQTTDTSDSAADGSREETPEAPVIDSAADEQSLPEYPVELTPGTIAYLEQLKRESPATMSAFHTIFDYMVRYAPGKIVAAEQCGAAHGSVYNAMRRIIRDSGESYRLAIGCLLLVIAEHSERGIFGMSYATRYIEHARMNDQELHGYVHLINLLREIAPPETRKKAVKTVNLEKALNGLSEQEKQFMREFIFMFE